MAFPNVPIAPGVPPIPRDPQAIIDVLELLVADEPLNVGLRPIWGVYQNGQPVIVADTVVGFAFKGEEVVADYPVERGGFESYDKVDRPFEARVQFMTGGGPADRAALLNSVEAAKESLDLYDVVTPEIVYTRANVSRYDYRRTSTNGVHLLIVDVWLTEIRIQGESDFTKTKSPAGASPLNGGAVQPVSPVLLALAQLPLIL